MYFILEKNGHRVPNIIHLKIVLHNIAIRNVTNYYTIHPYFIPTTSNICYVLTDKCSPAPR